VLTCCQLRPALQVFFFIAVLSLHPRQYAEEHLCSFVPPFQLVAEYNFTRVSVKDGVVVSQEVISGPTKDLVKENKFLLDFNGIGKDDLSACMTPKELSWWPEFFKMPVLMLMLITLLNDGTLISVGYDHVKPSHYPEKWNLYVSV
jgi:hypothetical protein